MNISRITLSSFGDYQDISATSERIFEIISKLKLENYNDFLPTTIIGKNIDVDKGIVTNDNRMVFNYVLDDKTIVIELPPERLNVSVQYTKNLIASIEGIEADLEECSKIIRNVMTCLNIKSRRLALNINFISNSMTKTEISEFSKSKINVETFYEKRDIFEFSLMYNSISKIRMNDDEDLNTIRNIQVINNGTESRLLTLIDLNTSQNDNRLRFSSSSIKSFVKQTRSLVSDLCGLKHEETDK